MSARIRASVHGIQTAGRLADPPARPGEPLAGDPESHLALSTRHV